MSNSGSAVSSALAASSRRLITSGDSVFRLIRRRSSSSHDGGARKTSNAPGTAARTWRALVDPLLYRSLRRAVAVTGKSGRLEQFTARGHVIECPVGDEEILPPVH